MKRTELLKEIVKKQDRIIHLLSLNDAFFNVLIAVLNEEVTVIKADLKQLEECEESETHVIDEMDNSPYEIIFNGRTYIRK
jgi:hypothetical protein